MPHSMVSRSPQRIKVVLFASSLKITDSLSASTNIFQQSRSRVQGGARPAVKFDRARDWNDGSNDASIATRGRPCSSHSFGRATHAKLCREPVSSLATPSLSGTQEGSSSQTHQLYAGLEACRIKPTNAATATPKKHLYILLQQSPLTCPESKNQESG